MMLNAKGLFRTCCRPMSQVSGQYIVSAVCCTFIMHEVCGTQCYDIAHIYFKSLVLIGKTILLLEGRTFKSNNL